MKQNAILLALLPAAACVLAAACASAEEAEPTSAGVPTALPAASLPTAVPPAGGTSVWAVSFVHEFPASFWRIGQHQYGFFMDCPELGQLESAGEYRFFQVTGATPAFDDPVYLRLAGLSTGPLAPINLEAIHPEQVTIAVVTILGVSEEQALNAADSSECEVVFGWDGISAQSLVAGAPFQP